MSRTHPTASSSSSSSNFQLVINNALDTYKKRTKNDLLAHPLATRFKPVTLLVPLSLSSKSKFKDQISLGASFSSILAAGACLAFPPANVIFAGVGVLLSTVKDVRSGKDTLVDIFERMEMFFRRVEVYTEAQPTSGMMDIIIRILVEVLSILGIATKETSKAD
ncbi:hypothetical protein BGY98DRAFT_1189419 [Russula aff. rugulosa BPL654]|nr:hypothetical protein BGY98DRAFT_1189419 [Russula aff. rugulosa BPL654]